MSNLSVFLHINLFASLLFPQPKLYLSLASYLFHLFKQNTTNSLSLSLSLSLYLYIYIYIYLYLYLYRHRVTVVLYLIQKKKQMGRAPCCEKAHTNKGAWTKEEDQRLIDHIRQHGEGCWRSLPKAAGTYIHPSNNSVSIQYSSIYDPYHFKNSIFVHV